MRAAIAAIIAFALLLTGLLVFRGGGTAPSGVFRGARNIAVFPGTDPAVADQLRRVQLRLNPDGAGVLEDGGIPYEGRATLDRETLTFEVLAIGGVNIDRQPAGTPRAFTFKVGADGTIEFDGVRLKRVASGAP